MTDIIAEMGVTYSHNPQLDESGDSLAFGWIQVHYDAFWDGKPDAEDSPSDWLRLDRRIVYIQAEGDGWKIIRLFKHWNQSGTYWRYAIVDIKYPADVVRKPA